MSTSQKRTSLVLGLVSAFMLAAGLAACDMHSTYDQFVEDGENVYPARVDSVVIAPGEGRVQMTFYLPPDPNVQEVGVFWNTGEDSTFATVAQDRDQNTLTTIVEGLGEGSRSFNVYTYDSRGNRSLATSANGRVFGESYRNSLLPWRVETASFAEDTLDVQWGNPPSDDTVGAEIYYSSTSGANDTLFVSVQERSTQIVDYSFSGNDMLEYSTLYVPEGSIDTLYTEAVAPVERGGPVQ